MVEVRYKIYRVEGYIKQITKLKFWLADLDADSWDAPLGDNFVLAYLIYRMQFKNPEDAVAFKVKFGTEWNGNS